MINIIGPKGQRLRATERAYKEIYKAQGYKSVSAKPSAEEVKEAETKAEENSDYASQTAAALKRVKNEKLSAYLDDKGIEYQEDATKEDLIELIKG
ncbi:hypothetical protein [Jeotgalibacillus campisalis]|uniref:T4 recombination endonuclease VII dimerisation domain-containing protein n=1 Tax=Jeotgalibacillus campisalis TaxID=220754 RepID=A0A0C2R7D4_9BACL|nr:hypothetical protein [Jeotgalibacillus campisalis]KIL46160.1 hypothetical protein KR50_28350 [Jeotgalibacillus campisalis]